MHLSEEFPKWAHKEGVHDWNKRPEEERRSVEERWASTRKPQEWREQPRDSEDQWQSGSTTGWTKRPSSASGPRWKEPVHWSQKPDYKWKQDAAESSSGRNWQPTSSGSGAGQESEWNQFNIIDRSGFNKGQESKGSSSGKGQGHPSKGRRH